MESQCYVPSSLCLGAIFMFRVSGFGFSFLRLPVDVLNLHFMVCVALCILVLVHLNCFDAIIAFMMDFVSYHPQRLSCVQV